MVQDSEFLRAPLEAHSESTPEEIALSEIELLRENYKSQEEVRVQ